MTVDDSWSKELARKFRLLERLVATRRALALSIVAVVAIVLITALVIRPDRIIVARLLATSCNCRVGFDGLGYSGGLSITNLRMTDEAGRFRLTVPQANVAFDFAAFRGATGLRGIDATLQNPTLALLREDPRVGPLRDDARTLRGNGLLRHGFAVRVHGGAVSVAVHEGDPPLLALSHVEGAVRDIAGVTTYGANFVVDDGADAYPVRAFAKVEGTGIVHRWSADTVPLGTVAALLWGAQPISVRSGKLHGLTAVYDEAARTLQGTATLDAADVAFGAHETVLHNVTGEVDVDAHGIASPGLRARVAAVPVTIAGELENSGQPFGWLRTGLNDLPAFLRLTDSAANEPNLQTLDVKAVAPGVAFARYLVQNRNGPVVIHVIAANPAESTLRIDTALAEDHVISGGERTTKLAERTGALAGVNGDYYDIGRTWEPQGLLVHDGRLIHMPTQRMAMTVHRDNTLSFEEYTFTGTVSSGGSLHAITMFNVWPPRDISLMTPDYGNIRPADGVTFVSLVPVDGAAGTYRVVSVAPANEKLPPSLGLAYGPLQSSAVPKPGAVVTVKWDTNPSYHDVTAALGGGPVLVRDGKWFEDPHAPAPDERDVHWAVVGPGVLPDKSLLIFEVDARRPLYSNGMTRPEFGALMLRFGVTDGFALDSGGSATMVARMPGDDKASLVNRPSDDDGERWVADGLFLYSTAPLPSMIDHLRAAPAPSGEPTTPP